MSFRNVFLAFTILATITFAQKNTFFVSGYIYNSSTKEPLENCNIQLPILNLGAVSDNYGFFNLALPIGTHKLRFTYVGFKTEERIVSLSTNNKKIDITINLQPKAIEEDEVKIFGKKKLPTTNIQIIDSKDIQLMPTINSDVLRSVQILSGVTTGNELNSGYNVRGGTFDENLIYLNGYEIYRPFLLRTGVEESQTLINPDMVSGLTFYNGAFPAKFGDRMASVLEVEYNKKNDERLQGGVRIDFLNLGANLKSRYKKLSWNIGTRYAYPTTFLNTLQTRGDYESSFSDIQVLTNYEISESSDLELFGIYAENKFKFIPKTWDGNFGGFRRGDQRGLSIDFLGDKTFSYYTNLFGLKYQNEITKSILLNLSVSKYLTEEKENYNTSNKIYYYLNPLRPEEDREYLKTQFEQGNNFVKLNSYRTKAYLNFTFAQHIIDLGTEYRFVKLENQLNESFYEEGEETLLGKSFSNKYNANYTLKSFSLFAEDNISFSNKLNAKIGIRFLNYEYSNENLISPRVTFSYQPTLLHNITFSWGYYYQPPFINELRGTRTNNLKSQKAIHYVLNWEYLFKEKLKLKTEIYYKNLQNLIPFYFDEYKMIYTATNNREGFAKGIDIMVEGELVDGMKSWFGYSYLDTRERKIGFSKFHRRLYDQTHTLQIFFQDKMGKHKNWQSHLRFLAGSGFLYYNRYLSYSPLTKTSNIEISFENPNEYLFYLRVDMGLSANFDIGNGYKIIGVTEILNIFNRYNAGAYIWVQALKEIKAPINIPQILSKRFFNIRLQLVF